MKNSASNTLRKPIAARRENGALLFLGHQAYRNNGRESSPVKRLAKRLAYSPPSQTAAFSMILSTGLTLYTAYCWSPGRK